MFKSKKIKTRIFRGRTRLIVSLFAVIALIAGSCFFNSCNVTRKITTQSEYVQHGDTNVVIVTKTIESYDATKKINPLNY